MYVVQGLESISSICEARGFTNTRFLLHFTQNGTASTEGLRKIYLAGIWTIHLEHRRYIFYPTLSYLIRRD